jgi:uncharacterized protein (DUF924 family)
MGCMDQLRSSDDVVQFWGDAGPAKWFSKDESFDRAIRDRFLPTYEAAARGDLDDWELTPEGALAVVLLLDQFPRNMFRGDKATYRTDPLALLATERAIERGHDMKVAPQLRAFFYLPFMHSEDLSHQQRSVALNEALGAPESIKFAHHHRDIVARFGRFPHRNAVLGRDSTPEEIAFLEESDFRG